jgi:hypothetical protein
MEPGMPLSELKCYGYKQQHNEHQHAHGAGNEEIDEELVHMAWF